MSSQVIELTKQFLIGQRDFAEMQWLLTAAADDVIMAVQTAIEHVKDASPLALKNLISLSVNWADQQRTKSVYVDDFGVFSGVFSDFYRALAGLPVPRHDVLSVLTTLGGEDNVKAFVQLLTVDPPTTNVAATVPFLPLFRQQSRDAELLFPDALKALEQPVVAGAVLDVANYLMRQGRVEKHPASERIIYLKKLLDGVVVGLEELQRPNFEPTSDNRREQWENSIALTISLCDTLALVGDTSSIGSLTRLLDIQHRRLRVEAAAALAKLGDSRGLETLQELVAEPVVRLRVIAYAEELGIAEKLGEQWQSPVAIAEAELVTHLADNTNMGIPPVSCELVDSRTQYWPGYEEPRMCYLFRYTYRAITTDESVSTYSNIGIAGPLVHHFTANLADFGIEDIYAAFAGWQAEHGEIYEITGDSISPSERGLVEEFLGRLEGFQNVELDRIGVFFEDRIALAQADRDGVPGVLVVDANSHTWYPTPAGRRSIGLEEAYCIYKGQRLLRSFNE